MTFLICGLSREVVFYCRNFPVWGSERGPSYALLAFDKSLNKPLVGMFCTAGASDQHCGSVSAAGTEPALAFVYASYFAESWRILKGTTSWFRSCSSHLSEDRKKEIFFFTSSVPFESVCLLGFTWQWPSVVLLLLAPLSACVNVSQESGRYRMLLNCGLFSLSPISFIHSLTLIWEDELN